MDTRCGVVVSYVWQVSALRDDELPCVAGCGFVAPVLWYFVLLLFYSLCFAVFAVWWFDTCGQASALRDDGLSCVAECGFVVPVL